MSTIRNIKRAVISDLYTKSNIKMVNADNNNRRPELPYATVKTITHSVAGIQSGNYKSEFVKSSDPKYKYDIKETLDYQPTASFSITAIADTEEEAQEMASDLNDYFKFIAKPMLSDMNLTVVDVGDVGNRSIILADELSYDYQFGFDITIRYVKCIERKSQNIESWQVSGKLGDKTIKQKGEINNGE